MRSMIKKGDARLRDAARCRRLHTGGARGDVRRPLQERRVERQGGRLDPALRWNRRRELQPDRRRGRELELADVRPGDAGRCRNRDGLGLTCRREGRRAGGHSGRPAELAGHGRDSLLALQWDMRQIHTPEAHAITGGSPAVVVGDIDTGLDYDHPDLVANIDVADSARCVSGAPVTASAAWDDHAATARTPPARSRRRRTASASSASRRGSRSPGSSRRTTTATSSRAHGRLLVRVGGRAPDRRDEQQLLRGPVAVQLPQRRRRSARSGRRSSGRSSTRRSRASRSSPRGQRVRRPRASDEVT